MEKQVLQRLQFGGQDGQWNIPLGENVPLKRQSQALRLGLGVEVALARSREMALTDEDIYVRRTRLTTLGLTPSAGSRRG